MEPLLLVHTQGRFHFLQIGSCGTKRDSATDTKSDSSLFSHSCTNLARAAPLQRRQSDEIDPRKFPLDGDTFLYRNWSPEPRACLMLVYCCCTSASILLLYKCKYTVVVRMQVFKRSTVSHSRMPIFSTANYCEIYRENVVSPFDHEHIGHLLKHQ